jgi:general secretion pathway protein L
VAEWLLLRLAHTPGRDAAWLIADASGSPVGAAQRGALSGAAPAAAGRRVCVLVPGTDVLLAEPEVPAKAGVKLQQLVPYALEEHLAEDIEQLHFAVGKRAADSGRAPVAVVSHSLMREWLAALHAAQIEPECLYADSALLPENPGQAVALLEEDAVFVRAPGAAPVSLPADALAEALESARAVPQPLSAHVAAAPEEGAPPGAGPATHGLILYADAAEWQRHSPQVEAARANFEGVKVQLLGDGPLALFAQQLPATRAINLLQGAYAPQGARAVGLRAWRIAAVLLLCLAGLHLAGKTVELQVLKGKERQVDASIRDTFQTAMPGETSWTDARRRMEQRLQALRGGGGSAGLLGALEAVAEARGAGGPGVLGANFHDGSLELRLSAPDAASLDRLSQQLRARGWQADLIGGSTVGNAYEGRVQIRGQGT